MDGIFNKRIDPYNNDFNFVHVDNMIVVTNVIWSIGMGLFRAGDVYLTF